MEAYFRSKSLEFKKPSGTSRGVLKVKKTWYIILREGSQIGVGECSPLEGLSIDNLAKYEEKLNEVCLQPKIFYKQRRELLKKWPSIQFGIEMAFLDLQNKGNGILIPSEFNLGHRGIPINGLIWMGESDFMKSQIKNLLQRGFRCLKMKIGAINFEEELDLLSQIRREYPVADLTLRVDANGAFHPDDALEKLKILSDLDLHSIEQPIKAGQWHEMSKLCKVTPLAIALDEELIPIVDLEDQSKMLDVIQPQYIILKPSLLGGFEASKQWIDYANERNIGWWITSALESNVGLNAISQWTYSLNTTGHQGLGTGSLYTNNIASPLVIDGEMLYYKPGRNWDFHELF